MVQRNYIGEIDYFAVYCLETAGVYLIPIAEAQLKRMGILRVEPARNNQRRFIRQIQGGFNDGRGCFGQLASGWFGHNHRPSSRTAPRVDDCCPR